MSVETMNVKRRKSLLKLIILLLLLGTIIGTSLACERPIPVRVVNQTDQVLTIFIRGNLIGDVKPGEEIKNESRFVSTAFKDYLVEAKNTQGDTIYSRSFTYDQLNRDLNLRVDIPPLEKGTVSSDNITRK
jgi:hypothetical protein